MKTRPEDLAFPIENPDFYKRTCQGLTKREYFVAKAMQALLANPHTFFELTEKIIAERALIAADTVIEALNEGDESECRS